MHMILKLDVQQAYVYVSTYFWSCSADIKGEREGGEKDAAAAVHCEERALT